MFSVWKWKGFFRAFSCTERFTKSRIFYTLEGTQIPCTHPFLLLNIWDSKGARSGLLLPKISEGRVLRCPTQKRFFRELPSYLTLPAPVPAPLKWCWIVSRRYFWNLPKEEKKAILNDQINSSSVILEIWLRNLITKWCNSEKSQVSWRPHTDHWNPATWPKDSYSPSSLPSLSTLPPQTH